MFSTPSSLQKRKGKCDADRPTYIKQLVEEFESPNLNIEYKEQILANLGNFAYDPINYEYFRRFNVIDLFFKNLNEFCSVKGLEQTQRFSKMVNFSTAAICNLCLDEKNKVYLVKNGIVNLFLRCLSQLVMYEHEHLESLLNIITTFIFIYDENSSKELVSFSDNYINFISLINEFARSKNKRLSNLALVFLEDYFKVSNISQEKM